MVEVVLWIVWGVAFLPAWRWTFRALLSDDGDYRHTDWFDIILGGGVVAGMMAAMAGPLILLGLTIRRVWSLAGLNPEPENFARIIGGETPAVKEQRRRQELLELQRKNERLERELEIERGE